MLGHQQQQQKHETKSTYIYSVSSKFPWISIYFSIDCLDYGKTDTTQPKAYGL